MRLSLFSCFTVCFLLPALLYPQKPAWSTFTYGQVNTSAIEEEENYGKEGPDSATQTGMSDAELQLLTDSLVKELEEAAIAADSAKETYSDSTAGTQYNRSAMSNEDKRRLEDSLEKVLSEVLVQMKQAMDSILQQEQLVAAGGWSKGAAQLIFHTSATDSSAGHYDCLCKKAGDTLLVRIPYFSSYKHLALKMLGKKFMVVNSMKSASGPVLKLLKKGKKYYNAINVPARTQKLTIQPQPAGKEITGLLEAEFFPFYVLSEDGGQKAYTNAVRLLFKCGVRE